MMRGPQFRWRREEDSTVHIVASYLIVAGILVVLVLAITMIG